MNKIYKVLWNEARKCYVVVAEIAKNHGKNNVRSIVERLAAKSAQAVRELFTAAQNPGALPAVKQQNLTPAQWIVPLLLAGALLQPASAWATQITAKSGEGGVIEQNGNVYNVYAQEIAKKGDFGVNRFDKFNIDNGHIANMHFNQKGQTTYVSNLVNLVNSRINVNGTVNAIKNGKIDGNLYFISPKGMAVGPTGVINAGSLTALAVSSDYFDNMWDSTSYVGTDKGLSDDLKNFGRREKKGDKTDYIETNMELATGSGDGVKIEGKINTRSGIVLGAGDIKVVNGAQLQSKKDIDFSSLVNTSSANAGLGDAVNVTVDKAGDIILRAENTTSYTNNAISSETYDAIVNSSNKLNVEVDGSLVSDGNVDVSASATSTFDNTNWNLLSQFIDLQNLGQSFLNQMGINWAADFAVKNNKASVKLAQGGSISAGGNATLQSDAKVDVRIMAATLMNKTVDSAKGIPVFAVAVAQTDNDAKVDVEGAINAGGSLSMGATATSMVDLTARANAMPTPGRPADQNGQGGQDGDQANQIFLGVSWLDGDNKAEVNVANPQSLGDNSTIKAGGVIATTAVSVSKASAVSEAIGKDETFASTAISVVDYDSAANVNMGRSMEAGGGIIGVANNTVIGMNIKAKNGNGEGSILGDRGGVSFAVRGSTNADTIMKKILEKFNLTAIANNGKLQGLGNAFKSAQEYVTAGAGVGVMLNNNTAHLTVAPDVTLTANGDIAPDIDLSSSVSMSGLHHSVTGTANKRNDDTASHVVVAAAVNYSDIENDAVVEVGKGAKLTAVKGNVKLSASSKEDYNALDSYNTLKLLLGQLVDQCSEFEGDYNKLKDLYNQSVTLEKQASDGTLSESDASAGFWNLAESIGTFLSDEAGNLAKMNQTLVPIVTTLSSFLDVATYTNYYTRSHIEDKNTNKVAAAISLNIAELQNKSAVSVGEQSEITAGKNIEMTTDTKIDVVSGTGNGGEYFGFNKTNGNGVGASVAVEEFSGDSIILVGKGAKLNADKTWTEKDDNDKDVSKSGSVSLNARNDMDQVGIILAAGEADGKINVTGSANALIGDSNSLVLVDDEAKINAAGTLTAKAENDSTITNIVGGLALGSAKTNANVGMGLALNMVDVNGIAAVADNGKDASTKSADVTGTIEEQNEIKTQNTLAKARKLSADRTKGLSTDGSSSLRDAMGTKTEGNAKGSLTAKDVEVTSDSGGTINAIALEGASNSNNHSALDTIDKWSKVGETTKNQMTTAAIGVVNWPLTQVNTLFDVSKSKTMTNWNFGDIQAITAPNTDASTASFNASAVGSFAWNEIDSDTAAVIDNTILNLGGTNGAGTLLNKASDDLFNGAWAGSAAWNWFKGGAAGSASNNSAIKGALGTAIAVNRVERNVKAVVSDTDISGAGRIDNYAEKDGTDVAIALGIATTNDKQGTSTNGSVAFGFSYNESDNDIHALLIDNTSKNDNSKTEIVNSAYDADIQVAGGIDFSYANSANNGRAVSAGITCAVSLLDNDIQSGIQGGSYTSVKDMQVKAEESLTQVNVAAGLGFSGSEKGFTGSAALAYSDLDNENHAYISGTEKIEASGKVSAIAQDVSQKDSNSYNARKTYLENRDVDPTGSSYLSDDAKDHMKKTSSSTIVNVGVQVAATKSTTGGAAIVVSLADNQYGADISNNKNITADAVKGEANLGTDIVAVGAGVSVSTKNFGGAGSLAFNDLDQDNIVSITGNRNGNSGGITAGTVSGTANNTSNIINITGDFAGGKNAVGLGIAYNRMDDTTGVYASNNRIQAKDAAKGVDVSLNADNDAYALALSVGAAATFKGNSLVAANGNFGVNRGHNDTIAVMGEDKDGNQGSSQIVNASSVTAKATDDTSKTTIAGSGELSLKDTTVALGIGVALTESDTADTENGDGKETLRAEINNADITTVKKNGTAAAISATTTDKSKATTVAAGVGFAKKSVIGASGIGADANIYKTNSAGLKDTTIDKNDTTRDALVTVKAETASYLDTGAAAVQLSLTDSLITGIVAVGVNRIKDTTSAGVTYTDKQASTSMNVGNLDISASSKGEILSVAAGAAGTFKGTAALGGSGSYNYIENNAAASVVNADVNSTGNVGVVARSDEAISNYAGVLSASGGNMTFAAAIGVTGSNNKISGKTSALIDNSRIVARGSDSNKIKTESELKTGDYLIDGAVTTNTWKSSKLQKGRKEEQKKGVVVDASATHSIASVMANGGVAFSSDGLGLDVAGVINLNDIGGSTTAKILDSQVNTKDIRSDVNVHAADYTNLGEFSGAVSVGIGSTAALAAGVTVNTNDISRVTTAGVSTSSAKWNDDKKQYDVTNIDNKKNTIYAKDFSVTADAKQAMSSFNVAGAIAGGKDFSFETGDNVVTNDMKSSTIALVTNATVDYTDNAKVEANHEDRIYNMNIDAGLSLAFNFQQGMAGSLNIGVGLVDEDSTVTADVKNSVLKKAENSSSSTLSIGANNKTTLEATLVSVGAAIGLFSVGIASSVAVNNIDTRVTSRIVGSELTADTLTINTGNEIKLEDATGTGGGGLLAGIGVGVDVNTLSETVSTIVDNSKLTATDTLTVNTGTQRDIASTVAGVGVGAAGVSVNVLAVTVNEGIADLGYAEDADGNSTSFNHAETINQVLNTVNSNNDRDYSEYFHGMTKAEKKEMNEKTKTDIKAKQTVKGGTGVHTYVQNASELQATNSLTVQNTEKNDADLNGGSGSLGALAVNVADVVYDLNALNDISVKNSTVKGGSVSLTTHQGNKKADDDEAIMVQTVQAGLGGLAIGVGYAGLTTKGNTGITIDHGTLAATNGDLTVKSSDDVRSKSNMIGVSAAAVAVPVSVAHNTNKANNFVTVKGGSTLTAETSKTQVVTDSQGNQVTEEIPAYINLQTERSGRVAAKTIGVGVGGLSVIVNTAKVYDKSTSAVSVEGSDTVSDTSSDKNGNTFTADAIRLEAVNAPVVRAEAGGTGVSALGVSVMQSNAEAYSSAKVDVKDDNSLLGDAVLAQAVIGREGTDMTHAETHGTNVSVGVGVNPNKAKAITETTASVYMGKEIYKTEKKECQIYFALIFYILYFSEPVERMKIYTGFSLPVVL